MKLTVKLIYESKIKIVGENGRYPQTDNCYVVEITEKDGSTWTGHFAPKPVITMLVLLQSLKRNLTQDRVEELIRAFNSHGDWAYLAASDSAAMDAAGADI